MPEKMQKTCRRGHQASNRQQYGCAPQPVTLQSILQEAPALLECLTPHAKSALSSCNRQLRAYFRRVTKLILLDQEEDITALTINDWPMLTTVVLCKAEHFGTLSLLCTYPFAHLARLKLAGTSHHVVVCLVERKGRHAAQQLSTALLHLHQPQYAHLLELSLEYVGPLDIHSAANLVIAGWEQLTELYLCYIELDVVATRCLANASWPKLTRLILNESGLDEASMTGLVQGQWVELTELDLSLNQNLNGAAISLLASANWPKLKSVELECNPLCSGSFGWLSAKEWTALSSLNLKGTDLNAPLVSELAHSHIRRLNSLDLGCNNLGADEIAALVTAAMPMLVDLDLSENQLDAASAQWLSRGMWPDLEFLDVSDNCLDNQAMQHLAQGQWQHLATLSLDNNDFDSAGIESLTKGIWTNISYLQLDTGLGSAALWHLLDLDPQVLPDSCANFGECTKVPRLEQGSRKSWQALQEICFYRRRHCR